MQIFTLVKDASAGRCIALMTRNWKNVVLIGSLCLLQLQLVCAADKISFGAPEVTLHEFFEEIRKSKYKVYILDSLEYKWADLKIKTIEGRSDLEPMLRISLKNMFIAYSIIEDSIVIFRLKGSQANMPSAKELNDSKMDEYFRWFLIAFLSILSLPFIYILRSVVGKSYIPTSQPAAFSKVNFPWAEYCLLFGSFIIFVGAAYFFAGPQKQLTEFEIVFATIRAALFQSAALYLIIRAINALNGNK